MNEINELIEEIRKGNGFNWLCNGNGYNIRKDDLRTLCKELLYGIESLDRDSQNAVTEEMMENIPEYWIDDDDDEDEE